LPSSPAIAASTMLRSISFNDVQSRVKPLGSATMVIVSGTGTNR
jgi:hypothetical protein